MNDRPSRPLDVTSHFTADSGCLDCGWIPIDDDRYQPAGIWQIPGAL